MFTSVFFLLISLISFIISFDQNDFTNTKIRRQINLKNSIIYYETQITVTKNPEATSSTYIYLVPKNNTKTLVRLSAESSGRKLEIKKTDSDSQYDYYAIKQLISYDFTVYEDHFEKLEFKPKNIEINDPQLEVFRDTMNTVSFYMTKSQVTTILLPSESTRLIKYTMKNSNRSGDKIIYSLGEEYPPLTKKNLYIHYESNIPLVVMNEATKTFQVSHWGNIAVTEHYQIENIGAKLIGEFGRIDYDDSGRNGGKNALKQIRATLPLRSWGLWYRDEIGNVSTSVAKREWNDVDLVLNPRFPILGGWKSNFDIGYNLPSKFHVSTSTGGNRYMVNLTFGMPYTDMLAKNYTVKITLPEGADNIKVVLPVGTEYTVSYDKEFGCLDLMGRKSVIVNLNNMYDAFNTNIYVYYDYQWILLFVKPVILIVYFLILFAVMIIYSRANVSLARGKDNKEKAKIQ